MVFDSVSRYYRELHAEDGVHCSLPHVVISNLEHDSVDLTAEKMKELGKIGQYLHVLYTLVSRDISSLYPFALMFFSLCTFSNVLDMIP